MELMVTFPLVFGVFLLSIFFGLIVRSKITLTNAVHAGTQVLAKTNDCDLSREYVKAYFDKDRVTITCLPGAVVGDRVEMTATYNYTGTSLMGIIIPDTLLSAKAIAVRMK